MYTSNFCDNEEDRKKMCIDRFKEPEWTADRIIERRNRIFRLMEQTLEDRENDEVLRVLFKRMLSETREYLTQDKGYEMDYDKCVVDPISAFIDAFGLNIGHDPYPAFFGKGDSTAWEKSKAYEEKVMNAFKWNVVDANGCIRSSEDK